MTDSITFRSQLGGFNRTEVLSYIRELLEQNQKLMGEADALREALARSAEEAEKAAAAQEARIDRQNDRIAELETTCGELRKMQNEVKHLGAAMFDARRFSDQLISEANDKVHEMMDSAAGTAGRIDDAVESLLDVLNGSRVSVAQSFDEVNEALEALRISVGDFESKAASERRAFDFAFAEDVNPPVASTLPDVPGAAAGSAVPVDSDAEADDESMNATSDVIHTPVEAIVKKKQVIRAKPVSSKNKKNKQ